SRVCRVSARVVGARAEFLPDDPAAALTVAPSTCSDGVDALRPQPGNGGPHFVTVTVCPCPVPPVRVSAVLDSPQRSGPDHHHGDASGSDAIGSRAGPTVTEADWHWDLVYGIGRHRFAEKTLDTLRIVHYPSHMQLWRIA